MKVLIAILLGWLGLRLLFAFLSALIVGFLARSLFPAKDRIGWLATLGVGFLGGIVGRMLFGALHWPTHWGMGFVASLVGAFVLLFAYHVWVSSQGSHGAGPAA